ncbi:hypothetical protein KC316_g15447 [Hortaea werneckii]|nr:hypothetical protein KC324_g16505 [Hortaea werneckii]KAI7541107.1 hypothetical protein KC316_g15447 [Hortaea werneckii]
MLPTQPDVINGFDAFSPPGDSHDSSSAYNYSEHDVPSGLFGKETTGGGAAAAALPMSSFEDMLGLPPRSADQDRSMAGMLDDWLSAH